MVLSDCEPGIFPFRGAAAIGPVQIRPAFGAQPAAGLRAQRLHRQRELKLLAQQVDDVQRSFAIKRRRQIVFGDLAFPFAGVLDRGHVAELEVRARPGPESPPGTGRTEAPASSSRDRLRERPLSPPFRRPSRRRPAWRPGNRRPADRTRRARIGGRSARAARAACSVREAWLKDGPQGRAGTRHYTLRNAGRGTRGSGLGARDAGLGARSWELGSSGDQKLGIRS